jgi:hypothetical protein
MLCNATFITVGSSFYIDWLIIYFFLGSVICVKLYNYIYESNFNWSVNTKVFIFLPNIKKRKYYMQEILARTFFFFFLRWLNEFWHSTTQIFIYIVWTFSLYHILILCFIKNTGIYFYIFTFAFENIKINLSNKLL